MKKLISVLIISALILTLKLAISGIHLSATKYELNKTVCKAIFFAESGKAVNAIKYSEWIDKHYISVKKSNDKVLLFLSGSDKEYLKNYIKKAVNQQKIEENHNGNNFKLSDDAKTLTYETDPESQQDKVNSVTSNIPYILFLQMLEKGNADNLKLKVVIINSNTKNTVKTVTMPGGDLTVKEWS
ncbi:MAG: hypothetical protein IJO19_03010 [Clostridia bacterium]|nr:hypothetical protein [Clostridia bacterium]